MSEGWRRRVRRSERPPEPRLLLAAAANAIGARYGGNEECDRGSGLRLGPRPFSGGDFLFFYLPLFTLELDLFDIVYICI
jgi:hypothetical protein